MLLFKLKWISGPVIHLSFLHLYNQIKYSDPAVKFLQSSASQLELTPCETKIETVLPHRLLVVLVDAISLLHVVFCYNSSSLGRFLVLIVPCYGLI